MVNETKYILHHYEPKNRVREPRVIVFRQSGDPFLPCYDEVKEIYGKVRRLLSTVETWLEDSFDKDIKNQTVLALHTSITKTLALASDDVEELITKYQVTDNKDVETIKDVVVQLQEIADGIFEPYFQQLLN